MVLLLESLGLIARQRDSWRDVLYYIDFLISPLSSHYFVHSIMSWFFFVLTFLISYDFLGLLRRNGVDLSPRSITIDSMAFPFLFGLKRKCY